MLSNDELFFSKNSFSTSEDKTISLFKYIKLGKEILNTPETQNFIHLIDSISKKSKFEEVPFIFICASSGTGKTQLPFSLQIPLLYLINNSDMLNLCDSVIHQDIYLNYFDCSTVLRKCVVYDRHVVYNNDLSLKKIDTSDCKSMIAGFFVTLFSLVIEYRQRFNIVDENWALSQIKAFEYIQDKLFIKPVTLYEARVAISKMSEIENQFLPLVFLDESQKTRDRDDFLRDYKTLRKIIRNIGVIPVYMGTNACLVNFINKTSTGGSRTGDDCIWSYIVYKLAHPTQSFLTCEKNKILETIEQSNNVDLPIKEKFKTFVEQITSLLNYERPFFCNIVFEYLMKIAQEKFDNVDCCNIFESIINSVFSCFTRRKRLLAWGSSKDETGILEYNFCNFTLTSPEYNLEKQTTEYNQIIKDNKIPIDKASGVHTHIAYLFADPEWLPKNQNLNFFPLVLSSNEIKVLSIENSYTCFNFRPQQIFAPFSKESIGHLAFIGQNNERDLSFVSRNISDDKIIRKSVNKVFHDVFHNTRTYNTVQTIQNADWTNLEIISSVSALMATHYSGFKGVNSNIWLSNFFRELDLDANFKKDLPILDFSNCSENYKNIIDNIKVPFCSPTINAEWHRNFGEYLCKNGANLGVLHSFDQKQSRDFSIQQSFNCSKPIDIISGECKYRKDGLTFSILTDIIGKLCEFESVINLIVTNKLNDNLLSNGNKFDNCSLIRSIEQSFCILRAIHNKNENLIQLKEIYSHRYSNNNMKIFIFFALE